MPAIQMLGFITVTVLQVLKNHGTCMAHTCCGLPILEQDLQTDMVVVSERVLFACTGKSYGQRSLVGYSPWGCRRFRHDLATKQQQQQKA